MTGPNIIGNTAHCRHESGGWDRGGRGGREGERDCYAKQSLSFMTGPTIIDYNSL